MSYLEPICLNKNLSAELKDGNEIINNPGEENYFISQSNEKIENSYENFQDSSQTINDVEKNENKTKFNLNAFFKELMFFFGVENSSCNVNGEIDEEFHQGRFGNCAMLSAIYSISTSKQGRKAIKDAITINKSFLGRIKSYSVNFKGIDETFTITKKELEEAEKAKKGILDLYSEGDDDVLLLELAWEKCCKEAQEKLSSLHFKRGFFGSGNGLDGVDQLKFVYSLTGAEYKDLDFRSNYLRLQSEENAPKILEIFETQKEFKFEEFAIFTESQEFSSDYTYTYCCFEFNQADVYEIIQRPSETEERTITIKNKTTNQTATFDAKDLAESLGALSMNKETREQCFDTTYNAIIRSTDFVTFVANYDEKMYKFSMDDINGESRKIFAKHAYGVKSINENEIILVNPHDTSIEMVFSKDELKKYSKEFYFLTYNFPKEEN